MAIHRRIFLKRSGAALLANVIPRNALTQVPTQFDLVIRNGTVLDGTGNPAVEVDLGVIGDTIAATGKIPAERAREVVDASGLCVSPGFVDIHAHSDSSILRYPEAESRVYQGITTELTGNCGSSAAPFDGTDVDKRRIALEQELGQPVSWNSVETYLNSLEKTRISVNHALLIGQGTVRTNAVGMVDRPLKETELQEVLTAVDIAMAEGAFGLSTGLEYIPGRFTETDEIIAMARVVSRHGGLYASHIRNEETSLLEAVNEAIQIGRESDVRVEVSHLKAAGRPNWAKQQAALHLIESARRTGVDVLADAYPYHAYSTGLTILVPTWALDGGWAGLSAKLGESAEREKIRREVANQVKQDPGDFDLILISSVRSDANKPIIGMRLSEIAEERNESPADTILNLLIEEEGSVSFIGFGMSPDNVEMVLTHPLVMIGSDGYSMAPRGLAAESRPHPRSYGSHARVLNHYVNQTGAMDLPTAIRKMTSLPADQIGIGDRGRIASGKKADLVVFDLEKTKDMATFDQPHAFAEGICHVLVNGRFVIRNFKHTSDRPGRVLRRA